MAAFPGGLPTFTGFTSSHTLAADSHAAQHNLEQAEIVQLATKLGTGASTSTNNTVLRGNGTGTSTWAQVGLTTDVTGVLPVANGGIGQNSLTGLTLPSPTISGTVSGGATYTSPVLTSPTIADFSNAQHDHGDADDGGQITSGAIPADAVNDSQLVYGKIRYRQGGSATDWSNPGTNNYDVSATNTFVQVGAALGNNLSDVTVTFPTAFSMIPVVIGSDLITSNNCVFITVTASTTVFSFRMLDTGGTQRSQTTGWVAYGQ